jgi:hypothetical protein
MRSKAALQGSYWKNVVSNELNSKAATFSSELQMLRIAICSSVVLNSFTEAP